MKKTFGFLSIFMLLFVSVKADLVLPEGMEILTPEGVVVTVSDARAVDKAKNMVVAGSPQKGYKVYFTAQDATHGEELWVSDGTKTGTMMVKDIFPGEVSSGVAWMQRFNDKVVFQAQSDTDTGVELWISDGTEAGTYMVKDIHFFGSSNPSGFTQLNENKFIFAAQDFDSETYGENAQRWLWISDGTENGTELLKDCQVFHPGAGANNDNGLHFARVGRKVFFKADVKEGTYGEELWVTDGTEAGTLMIKDINKAVANEATGATAGSQLDWLTNFYNEKLFFKAYSIDPAEGSEPFVSDGTPEGTHIIKDITPGVNASNLPNGGGAYTPRVYDGKVYFRGSDPIYGAELFVSDFTPEGTYMLKDFNTNPTATGTNNSSPDLFCEFDGVLFMKANFGTTETIPGNYGLELAYTDGSSEGTKMQSDMNPGIGNNAAWEGIVISGSFYFRAQNATPNGSQTWELFRLNGKDSIPVKVVDLVEGQDFVHSLRNLAGDVVFTSKAVPSLFRYHYRKPNYDPAKDTENMEINYEPRSQSAVQNPNADGKQLVLYPNPAQNYFSFDLKGMMHDITITDISGKIVYRLESVVNNHVNINGLQAGVYAVSVKSDDGVYKNLLIVK